MPPNKGFTLVELLVVIAIIAILSVVVIMAINPVEMLRKARDSNRSTDLNVLNKALSIYNTDQPSGSLGSATVVYVSLPDSSATCANLGLPTLPSGYTYNCATATNLRKTNGTGWVPVAFTNISAGAPFGTLPIDPVNTTSTGLYYTYIPGGSWELTATPESSTYKLGGAKDKVSTDGGDSPGQMEVGSNLALLPIEYGDTSLVGYWNFEEGTNATSTDRSGHGNNGKWYGAGAHYTTGKVGNYAGSFNGTNDYVNVGNSLVVPSSNFAFSLWFYLNQAALSKGVSESLLWGINLFQHSANNYLYLGSSGARYIFWTPAVGTWHHLACAVTSSGSSGGSDWQGICYGDGVLKNLLQAGYFSGTTGQYIGSTSGGTYYLDGLIDDVRIYNRALSAAEIMALYNATR